MELPAAGSNGGSALSRLLALGRGVVGGADQERRFYVRNVGIVALVVVALLVYVDGRRFGNVHTGDSDNLVRGARAALQCLRDGRWSSCGYVGNGQTSVFPYPLLQYLPATLMVWLQVSDQGVLEGLALLNFLAVVALVVATVRTLRARPQLAALAAVALAGSSLTFQMTSAFGEALAASVAAGAVLAAIRGNPYCVGLFVFLASISKETMPVFIVILVLCCARSPEDGLLPPRRLALAAGGAALLGVVVNAGFNVFRFGTWRNTLYLEAILRTPGIARKVDFLAGILLSPSAGVVWFWPLAATLFVLGVFVGARRLVRRPRSWRSWAPSAVVTVCMAGWLAGCSAWFSPFGWIAYGPRLEVPLLPAALIAMVHLVGDDLLHLLRTARWSAWVVIVAAAIGTIQIRAVWQNAIAVNRLIAGSGSCPAMTGLIIQSDPAMYYRCVHQVLWRLHPLVLGGLFQGSSAVVHAAFALAALSTACLVWFALSGSRENRSPADELG